MQMRAASCLIRYQVALIRYQAQCFFQMHWHDCVDLGVHSKPSGPHPSQCGPAQLKRSDFSSRSFASPRSLSQNLWCVSFSKYIRLAGMSDVWNSVLVYENECQTLKSRRGHIFEILEILDYIVQLSEQLESLKCCILCL